MLGCLPQLPRRHVICFLCFLGMTLTYIMRFCLAIAITVMVRDRPDRGSNESTHAYCPAPESDDGSSVTYSADGATNSYQEEEGGEFSWDEGTQGLVLSSFFWGYVVTQLPGGWLAERWGGKWTLAAALLVSAACSVATPAVARRGGPSALMVLRVVMGLGQGFVYPSLNALLAKWVPVEERGRFGSLVYAGANFGNVVSMSVSGLLLSRGAGWPTLFYLYGGATLAWLVLWVCLGYSRPDDHPGLSADEGAQLAKYAAAVNLKKTLPSTPWCSILTSVPLWGLAVAQIGHDWGLFTIITDLPKYMKSVLHFSIGQTGLRSALPYVAMIVVALLSGVLVDFLVGKKITSITLSRKIFTTVASVGPAVGIVGASLAECDRDLVTLFFVLGMGMMGFYYPSLKVNCLDLSPNYAGTVMALVNAIGASSGILTSYLVGVLIPDNSMQQWRQVFLVSAAMMVATNLVYVLTASGEIQPWNDPPAKTDHKSGKLKTKYWPRPWNPKQSWYTDPSPIRSASLFFR